MTRRARAALQLIALLALFPVHTYAVDAANLLERRPFYDVERFPGGLRAQVSLSALADSTALSALIAVPSGQGLSVALKDAPGVEAVVADPIEIHGVVVYPVQVRGTAGVNFPPARTAELDARFTNSGSSVDHTAPVRVSAEVARVLRRSVLNGDDLELETVSPVGRLLILVQDNNQFVSALQPYVQWKQQSGYRVTIAHPEDNTDPLSIKSAIQAEYFSDNPVPLEYVLLVGDHDAGSAIRMVGFRYDNNFAYNETDNWYGCMEGRLPVPDVGIGRFSVRDLNQLRIGVNKTLVYERDGMLDDPEWIRRTALTAGENSGISVVQTNLSIRWMFDRQVFDVDTLWYTMPNGGMIPQFIHDEIDLGVGFVNYRGYYGMSGWDNGNLAGLNNVGRLPVVVTITCGTGLWGYEETAISEGFFRAGTVNAPVGAVACIGTGTTDTHTRFNNLIDAGVFESLLQYNDRSLGWCLNFGKLRLGQAYSNTSDSSWIVRFCNWNNLMGDPSLRMWLNEPVEPAVVHESSLRPGSNHVDAEVSFPGDWPELVWATIANPDSVIDSRLVHSDGHVRLYIGDVDTDLPITLTVVGDDVIPYQATLPIQAGGQDLAVTEVTVHDGGDGLANPGETVILDLELHNYAAAAVSAGQATVSSSDPRVASIGNSTFQYPAISSGQSVVVQSAVSLTLAGWAQDGCKPAITTTFQGGRDSAIPLEVYAWELTSDELFAWTNAVGTGRIFPGETGELALPVSNSGRTDAENLSASLFFEDDRFSVLNNPVSFGSIESDSVRDNLAAPFQVQLSEDVGVGEITPFLIRFEDPTGGVDSVRSNLICADPRVAGATGPDSLAGYWAIDDQDVELIRPEFDWVDNVHPFNNTGLVDNHSGGAYQYGEEDASMVMELPFPFTYYGEVFHEVTINTNGWIALGDKHTIILFRNWPIPDPMGPPAMIAPFWDDLHTGDSGIYASYDEDEHRFIVTWDCVAATNEITPQVFQVILYDPTIYPTVNGNGRILFQYQDVSVIPSGSTDNDYITVGIESPDQKSGIEYAYWNFLRAGAEEISDGRAILFTDDLNVSNGYSEGSVSPDELEITIHGVEEQFVPLYIHNLGDQNLLWVLDARTGALPGLMLQGKQNTRELAGASPLRTISANSPRDTWGYYWSDETEPGAEYNWLEMPGATVFTEADLRIGTLNDGYFRGVRMPFTFKFYGSYYDSVFASPNGFLVFQGDLTLEYGTDQNRVLPSTWAPRRYNPSAMAAVWWDDLDLSLGGNVSVWTGQQDSVLVNWDHVYAGSHPGGPYTFQALLFKNGFIKMQYNDMDENDLLSSTIGIQNHDAEHGLQILLEQPFMTDELSLLVRYDSSWLEPADDFGILEPAATDTATLRVYSNDLELGAHEGYVIIRMSDADNPIWQIPLTVNVEGNGSAPVISEVEGVHLPFGYDFDPIPLDPYVTDGTWGPERIRWEVSGDGDLNIHVFNRTLYVVKPSAFWMGSETVHLTATNPEGNSDTTSTNFSIGDVSVAESDGGLPREFSVGSLYPNPFNPSVTMEIALPHAADVTIEVFDLLGRLVDRQRLPQQAAGYQRFVWDGSGRPSGVYFLHVRAGACDTVRKAVLMK